MIEILYSINILISILVIFLPAWYSNKYLRLPIFNPISLILVVFFPFQIMKIIVGPYYTIEGGLFNLGYQYALLMNNLFYSFELISIITLFSIFKNLKIENFYIFNNLNTSSKNIKFNMWIYLLIYIILMVELMNSEYGILNWLMNPREGYQNFRAGHGFIFALALSALSMSLICSFLSSPNINSVLIRSIPFMVMAYFFGSKTVLLSFFSANLIFLWFLKWRKLELMVVLITPVVFSIVLWNFYLAIGDSLSIVSIIDYFDYYKNASIYYSDMINEKISLFYGDIFISSFWSYVPRSFYPEKPYIYGMLHINEIYYPGYAELGHTPAFGGAVEQFADFGVAGVIFFGLLNTNAFLFALTTYLIFYKPGLILYKKNISVIIAFIILFGPNFGTYFSGFTYFLLITLVFLMFKIFTIKIEFHEKMIK